MPAPSPAEKRSPMTALLDYPSHIMSNHDLMHHGAGTSTEGRSGRTTSGRGFLKSPAFLIGLTLVVLLVGYLLARRFGIGGRLLPGLGLGAFMILGCSLMHLGHGGHDGHGSNPPDSDRSHTGCH